MNENGNVGFWCSWPVIIIALIAFWPVGVFLIIRRVTKDRKTAMGAGKLIGWLGIASYCMAALMLIACLGDGFTGDDIAATLFFVAAGVALRVVAKKIKGNAENVKNYLAVIVNGDMRQLDSIAASTGKSYEVVHADISKMIDQGYFKNAYIDESLRELVLPETTPAPQSSMNSGASQTQNNAKIVVCPCCGANNTIYGNVGECEYCATPLK